MRDFQISGAGIALLVLGALGPWVTTTGFSESGLNSDGIITLILGLIAGGFLFLAHRRKTAPSRIAIGIIAILCLAIAIIDINNVNDTDLGVPGFEASVGWGLWVTAAGSVVLAVSAVLMGRSEKPAI